MAVQFSCKDDGKPGEVSYSLASALWLQVSSGRGGKIRTNEEEEKRRQTGEKGRTLVTSEWERNEKEKTVCKALEKVAAEIGAKHINSVAIAYLMQKTPYVFPIIGGRKVEHLIANLDALEISLNNDQIKYLESVVPFEPGFPTWMIGDGQENGHLINATTTITKGPLLPPSSWKLMN
ncbi:hypothetical protein BYT27DRAFT_7250149 [Phlegmacium glaucopus]|nr:hypothetical protein BYT27DRAFT_7250149 [Phlegmacium glaucopus]